MNQDIESLLKRLEESERRQKELEERIKITEQQRDEFGHQLQKTTLPEFLDACYQHLFLGLRVGEKDSSTGGSPSNAEKKFRPDYIREWHDFPDKQAKVWKTLLTSDFVTERHFTPLSALTSTGEELRERSLGSELDLGYFERTTVENQVASVIKQLYKNSRLREIFKLKGDVKFENHGNTLTDERTLATDMGSLDLNPRRSQRLAAKERVHVQRQGPSTEEKLARPKADQFCVYNKGADGRIPAFIVEYKAPHKLSLAHIRAGLQDMALDEVVRLQEHEAPEVTCRRVIAAVITQVYSYMINGGIEYGYVCTGEAFIYIHVREDEANTAYYFLSVPKEDVGESTGWTADGDGDNRLHVTALGQVLAFTLGALQSTPRNPTWVEDNKATLQRWEMVYEDLLGKVQEKEIPASDYKPTRSRDVYVRMSPVRTRSRAMLKSCSPPQRVSEEDENEHSDGFDPDAPSRRSRSPQETRARGRASRGRARAGASRGASDAAPRQYCTQRCLRGLQAQSPLDPSCPNASSHGDRHRINAAEFIRLLSTQFHPPVPAELGIESLHVHGTRGALFRVTLLSHGYTLVGKGVPAEFVLGARHEEAMYARLLAIQGTYVPVVLGGLPVPGFWYDGIVPMQRFTLMSYVGRSVEGVMRECPEKRDALVRKAEVALRAVHGCGVLHADPIPGNVLWGESGEVMMIDFERALTVQEYKKKEKQRQQQRMPLMVLSPNRKRKRVDEAKSPHESLAYDKEVSKLRNYLLY
ncbi:hypothetical protein MY10362_008828 [Beauveria mimosiformis]